MGPSTIIVKYVPGPYKNVGRKKEGGFGEWGVAFILTAFDLCRFSMSGLTAEPSSFHESVSGLQNF